MDTNAVISQIGNTPLVKLKQASELTGCHIYGKAEYFNPGESVKDRAALFIVEDAIKSKKIQGITNITGWSIGFATFMTSLCVLICWVPLRQTPGLGTILNVIIITQCPLQ